MSIIYLSATHSCVGNACTGKNIISITICNYNCNFCRYIDNDLAVMCSIVSAMAQYMPHWHYSWPSPWCCAGEDESTHSCIELMWSIYRIYISMYACTVSEMRGQTILLQLQLFVWRYCHSVHLESMICALWRIILQPFLD